MPNIVRFFIALICMATLVVSPLLTRGASAGVVPSDAACESVEPMDLLDLFNLVDDLDEVSSSNAYLTTSVWGPTLQTGTDISTVDRAAIEETLDAFIACVNLRDPMRLFRLLSERYQALMIMDLLGGADAMSTIADQIPNIIQSEDESDPVATPDIERAWRPTSSPTDIWAVVSGPIPGYTSDVTFFVAFTPGGDGWTIDYIARYDE
jgi:hypothetical protein